MKPIFCNQNFLIEEISETQSIFGDRKVTRYRILPSAGSRISVNFQGTVCHPDFLEFSIVAKPSKM